ncbi:MFS transporter [Haliea sp. E17]|uniref:MFS transporter n=1 Tax=Haliea sp. E17 TaxID=3401576 RepID=UPI003AB03B7A
MNHIVKRIGPARLAAFASLEIPMSAFLTPLVVYIPAFYAGEMGLGLTTVGIIFGLAKLWDIVTDPIAGIITERFGPERGRWRFWLLLSLPLMMIGVYKVFFPPGQVEWTYFASWMLILYVGWTLLTISHISWGVELSDDYHERSRIAAFRQFAALVGGLVVVFIPVLSDQFAGVSESGRINFIGLFVLVALPVLMMATFFCTPVGHSRLDADHTYRWNDVLTILLRNPALRALLLGNVGVLLGIAAMSSVLLFYVESVLRLGEWATLAVVPMLFSGLLFLPLIRYLAVRIGKHRTFCLVLLFQILVQPLFLLIPAGNVHLTLPCFMLLGAINGAAVFLPQAMIADLKDIDTGSGQARTGVYVALLQSTSKVASALAVALMFLVLPLTGFDPGPQAQNDPQSLARLRSLIAGLPMACFALGLWGMRRYGRYHPATLSIGSRNHAGY